MAMGGLIWAVRTQATAEAKMEEISLIRQELHMVMSDVKEINNRIDRMDTPLSKQVNDNKQKLDQIRERVSRIEGKLQMPALFPTEENPKK
jgi:hypothetical protein